MTIGIIWSLAVKNRLIKKNCILAKTQNKEVNHWILWPAPPPPPFALFPKRQQCFQCTNNIA